MSWRNNTKKGKMIGYVATAVKGQVDLPEADVLLAFLLIAAKQNCKNKENNVKPIDNLFRL